MNKAIAWYRFAHRTWIALSIGWILALAGLTPYLRLDRAGAFLVCSALIAEVFNEKIHQSFLLQMNSGSDKYYLYKEIDVPGEIRKDIKVTPPKWTYDSVVVNTDQFLLYHLAKKIEFSSVEDTRMWHVYDTLKRVERRIEYAIVISALAGTILSAFGHNA